MPAHHMSVEGECNNARAPLSFSEPGGSFSAIRLLRPGSAVWSNVSDGSQVRVRSGVRSLIATESPLCSVSYIASVPGALAENQVLEPSSARVMPWFATSALVVAEVVGTGVLALGGEFAMISWSTGFLILLFCWAGNTFTGLLLGKVHRTRPDLLTFGDALRQLIGQKAGAFGFVSIYVYFFICIGSYLVILSDAVRSVFYWKVLCQPTSTAIGCLLLLPCNQLRSLYGLAYLSVMSFLTILVVLAICVYTLVVDVGTSTGLGCVGQPRTLDFLSFNGALSGFVFAFQGQGIMLEMQAEMRNPEEFPKAVVVGNTTLLVVYTLVMVAARSACGDRTPTELLLVLPDGPRKLVVGVFMTAHLMVCYTILQQVLCRAFALWAHPEALQPGFVAHVKWFCISTGFMACAYVLANAVPLFEDFVSVQGSLLSSQSAFTIPTMLALALWRRGQISNGVARLSIAVLCVGIYFTFVGTYASTMNMISHAHDGASAPFACKLPPSQPTPSLPGP